jgi:predicted HTH domain antitoxin
MELPKELLTLTGKAESELSLELKKLLALELVRSGVLTYGKASELMGISQAEFMTYLGQHGVSIFDYTDEELRQELAP